MFQNKSRKIMAEIIIQTSQLKVDINESDWEALTALFSQTYNFTEKLKDFEKRDHKIQRGQNLLFFSKMGVLAMVLLLSGVISFKWYSESVRTREEVRAAILDEISDSNKDIYSKKYVEKLEENTDLMNKWMKKNPKDADKFLRFKDGYNSK